MRLAVLAVLPLLAPVPVAAAAPTPAATARSTWLDATQSQHFRAWFTLIVAEQLKHGPNPRWRHRDCAGLVRFAVDEALRPHDYRWRRDNALADRPLPPDVTLRTGQQPWRGQWRQIGGTRGAFASAMALIQENSRFVSRDISQARPGDLLFFDQGDDQHLMIWMGDYIAYNTGGARKDDDGMRAVNVQQLFTWRDVRWQPRIDNPNFVGVFRLSFLSH
ncbi:MAG: DUF1175 family protein [Pseudomonadota bacterium]|jgi:uncharacterized protein YfaT (DUF1175 family)|nr:DUF1175 family protein [Pseudomonadota bacterium]